MSDEDWMSDEEWWAFELYGLYHPSIEDKYYWAPGPGLPRWTARDERDRERMVAWVNWELDYTPVEFPKPSPEADEFYRAWRKAYGPEIEHAEHGNIEPLRQRLPDLAKFLHLPKRGRGKRFPKMRDENDRVQRAAYDVRTIRDLWEKHYGKKRRCKNDGPSAEEIAADRYEVDVEDVIKRLKKSPAK
jgi:hypothetical protein